MSRRRKTSYPIRCWQMAGTAVVVAAPWIVVFGLIPWLVRQ